MEASIAVVGEPLMYCKVEVGHLQLVVVQQIVSSDMGCY